RLPRACSGARRVSWPAPAAVPVSVLSLRRPPSPPLFPYTTLFRSVSSLRYRCPRRTSESGPCVNVLVPDEGLEPSRLSTTHFERSEEHTSELQSRENLVCRLLLEKKNRNREGDRLGSEQPALRGVR